MKQKTILNILLVALFAIVYSCDDSLKNIGFTIQPDTDRIVVGTDSLILQARTVSVDELLPDGMFSKTKNPILGIFKDPLYGSIRSDYVSEFYYPEGKNFPDNATVDSIQFAVFYNEWQGDSLAPIGLKVYEIDKELPSLSHSTKFDPTGYVDMSNPIGSGIFTAANIEVPEEERNQSGYYHRAIVDLPKSLGERIHHLSETVEGLNTDIFKEYFKGVYVTTDFGTSSIVTVDHTYLYVHFQYLDEKGSSDKTKDTIRTGTMILNSTPEVIQINQIKNENDKLLEENSEYTYIKSPAGVYTEILFPFSQKSEIINKQALNLAKFVVTALPSTDSEYNLKPSPYLLLVNKDELKEFFEKRKMPDNISSFYAPLDKTTYTYNFGNLSAMVKHYKEKNKGEIQDVTYVLVPIDLNISSSTNQSEVTAIYNQMKPTATTIFKNPSKMKMEFIYSN